MTCLEQGHVIKRTSAADAKAHFSDLLARVAHTGERVIIEKHGKPVAALVNVRDLEKLEQTDGSAAPRGALALVGGWGELTNEEIDGITEEIYALRRQDKGRPVDLD
jgi:prevent-host-death family protein